MAGWGRFSVCSAEKAALSFRWFISKGAALDPASQVFRGEVEASEGFG